MRRIYESLLRLYPADYRAKFSDEMLATFESAEEARSVQGPWRWASFVFVEFAGLVTGAFREWFATPQQGRIACAAEICGSTRQQAEQQIATAIAEMVDAIARHDFPKARLCSEREREAREQLKRL